MSVGVLTLAVGTLLLYVLNFIIYSVCHPNVDAVLRQVADLSFYPSSWFAPEPVERVQYQLSLILLPFFIYFPYKYISRSEGYFDDSPSLARGINISSVVAFLLFFLALFPQKLENMEMETTAYFFNNSLANITAGALFPVLLLCALCVYLFIFFQSKEQGSAAKLVINLLSFAIVGLVVADMFFYARFNIFRLDNGLRTETNAVFYAYSQVYAGKSLLVDFNTQYGMHAWILMPLFRMIGFSIGNFGFVMGLLNAFSFVFIYLGIRRVIKSNLLALLVFLCLVYWQYWMTRIPLNENPRVYYQYWPLRILFPAICFYLVSVFFTSGSGIRKILLPVLALLSSVSVLWNLDSGIVLYGSVFIALLFSFFSTERFRVALIKSIPIVLWMMGSLVFVLSCFAIATKVHSGMWPDVQKAFSYQGLFYLAGFFMLPMGALHFWNIPVIIYIIAGIWCVREWGRSERTDMPLNAFLFILGTGMFSYFQGRSWDTNITVVLYPAVILLGIFADRLLAQLSEKKEWMHERTIVVCISLFFIFDGALTMLYHLPAIHGYSWDNYTSKEPGKENYLKKRFDFMEKNLHRGDTVYIPARTHESYFYAAGGYYNPLNIDGTTEIVFKKDLHAMLDFIRTCKYPILFDGIYPLPQWYLKDSMIDYLAKYTKVVKEMPDHSVLLLRPDSSLVPRKLVNTAATVFYSDLGIFNRYVATYKNGPLNNSYTIEAVVNIDSSMLQKNSIMFTNVSQKTPFCGVLMKQSGEDLTQYQFSYGNGTAWTGKVPFKLVCGTDNLLMIQVVNGQVAVFNNGKLCGQATGVGALKNSDGYFTIVRDYPEIEKAGTGGLTITDSTFLQEHSFPGVVKELMISCH